MLFTFSTPVSSALFAATLLISLTGLWYRPSWVTGLALSPWRFWHDRQWHLVLTSGFVHANMMHLAFNMIVFYYFCPVLEQVMGSFHFAALYLLALVLSDTSTVYRYRDRPEYRSLGASGALEGVVFSFILFSPLTSFYLFFIPLPIPAFIFGILFLLYSYYESKRGRSFINHEAHLLGALTGIIYTVCWAPKVVPYFLQQIAGFLGR